MDLANPVLLSTRTGHGKVNLLGPVIQTSMEIGSKVFFNHAVDSFNKNRVLRFKEVVARIRPPLDRFFDELPCDDEWIVVGKLSRLRPTLLLNSWTVRVKKSYSLECQVHNLIHIDDAIIRT